MTTYLFETITESQAAAFNGAADTLMVLQAQESGAGFIVLSDEATGRTTVTSGATGRSVVLGAGAAGESVTVSDGSVLVLPSAAAHQLSGTSAPDGLYGGGGADTLNGAAGNDLLSGGTGRDVLSGGTGGDTFFFRRGDSGTTDGALDAISDWWGEDKLVLSGLTVSEQNYLETITVAYADAIVAANTAIASGATDVVAVSVGSNVIVFADTANDNGGADDAIVLVGRGIADIGPGNLASGAPPPPTTPPPTPPTPSPATTYQFTSITDLEARDYNAARHDLRFDDLPGRTATDFTLRDESPSAYVLSGAGRSVVFGPGMEGERLVLPDGSLIALPGRDGETIEGGAKADNLFGGGGGDLLRGLEGADKLDGGGGDDTLVGGSQADSFIGGGGSDTFVFAPGDSGTREGAIDGISGEDWRGTNWQGGLDKLLFTTEMTGGGYAETAADSYAAAVQAANQQISSGAADVVAVRVSWTVFVFADTRNDNGVADDAIGIYIPPSEDIGAGNIIGLRAPVPVQPSTNPTPPPLPPASYGTSRAVVTGNMDAAHLRDLLPAVLSQADATTIRIDGRGGALGLTVTGSGFTYANDQLVGGTATAFNFTDAPGDGSSVVLRLVSSGLSVNAGELPGWLASDATQTAFWTLFFGSDLMGGGTGADLIRGYRGDDLIYGRAGGDTIWGGEGNDVIVLGMPQGLSAPPTGGALGPALPSYLRGEDGNDYIVGGDGFDDIHGNMGNDTGVGGLSDDWVVGGKGNDILFGEAGADIVYGNIGADSCDGGEGADTIRGGQDGDTLAGGAGNDWLSGDRGDDAITGGRGADLFHTFGDAGADVVTDFSAAEGDRVLLDPGTQYTVAQVGADTVVSMVGGGQMVLVGVPLSSLTPGWIFVG